MPGREAIVQDGSDVLLSVRIHPRASRNQISTKGDGSLDSGAGQITIRLTAPPVEGAANAACRTFLADRLGIAQSRTLIVHGEKSRNKLLRVRDADAASILHRLLDPKK